MFFKQADGSVLGPEQTLINQNKNNAIGQSTSSLGLDDIATMPIPYGM